LFFKSNTLTTKTTNEANEQAKLEAKKAQELANKQAYQQACSVFDGVIQSELNGVKSLLSGYNGIFEYDTSISGVLKIIYKLNSTINYYTLEVKDGNNINVSSDTITRLENFISNIIVYDLE
jgi:hypothetical protein